MHSEQTSVVLEEVVEWPSPTDQVRTPPRPWPSLLALVTVGVRGAIYCPLRQTKVSLLHLSRLYGNAALVYMHPRLPRHVHKDITDGFNLLFNIDL